MALESSNLQSSMREPGVMRRMADIRDQEGPQTAADCGDCSVTMVDRAPGPCKDKE